MAIAALTSSATRQRKAGRPPKAISGDVGFGRVSLTHHVSRITLHVSRFTHHFVSTEPDNLARACCKASTAAGLEVVARSWPIKAARWLRSAADASFATGVLTRFSLPNEVLDVVPTVSGPTVGL